MSTPTHEIIAALYTRDPDRASFIQGALATLEILIGRPDADTGEIRTFLVTELAEFVEDIHDRFSPTA